MKTLRSVFQKSRALYHLERGGRAWPSCACLTNLPNHQASAIDVRSKNMQPTIMMKHEYRSFHSTILLEKSSLGPDGHTKRLSEPQIQRLWQQAQAVCFDVDCTVTKQDSLDDLAEFLGVGDQVAALTNAAMDGGMDLDKALQQRLEIMEPTVEKLVSYTKSKSVKDRLVPGIRELIQELQARNIAIFLISGGFRELILPVADELGIPRENIFANRFVYQADESLQDKDGFPVIRVHGFDPKEPTSREGGKPEAIRRIRAMHPYQTIVHVGDGKTDLEAVQETGGADLFVGYGGVVERKVVKEEADWWITDHNTLIDALPRVKVAIIGSGSWASACAQMVSLNTRSKPYFQKEVSMWVHEEDYEGGKLSAKMNELHENPKYLPGVKYGDNVTAKASLEETVQDADILVFCSPHQYISKICKSISLSVKPTALAVSLVKGMHVGPDGPQLISSMIRRMLKVECAVLMGANIANEIGPKRLTEGTLASNNLEEGQILLNLFDTPYYHVSLINDVEGAEISGTLKNVVALAAGFADGSNMGQNTKAALLRQGLSEIRRFAKAQYPTVRDDTFYESCGMADLVATCYGGRNHKVAQEYAQCSGSKSFDELEKDLLGGQKLQGVLTSHEVQQVLSSRGWEKEYPLFTTVNAIIKGFCKPDEIIEFREIGTSQDVIDRLRSGERNRPESSLLETSMGV